MRFLVLVVPLLLAGCQTDKADEPVLEPVGAALVERERAACVASGGTFAGSGRGGLTCFHNTRDAGKQCSKASQCEGLCLARSQSCAPIRPLFGCQDILQNDGSRVTQCID